LLALAVPLRDRARDACSIQNKYSSIYLWRRDEGFRDFLVDGRTKSVTDSFGRPQIETRFVLDASKGSGEVARFLYKQEQAIAHDMDLTSTRKNWKLTRVLLSEREPSGTKGEEAYQILYLAKPLLELLPPASARQKLEALPA
jgi:hypothetical protein